MFNQLCSIVERHYPVPRILEHLSAAVPMTLAPEATVGVYDDWDLDELLDGFEMMYPALALDSKRECFVIADMVERQKGLYGSRVVMHCQKLDLQAEDVPDAVKDQAPTLPRDTVVVTMAKVFAVGKTLFNRVNFSGDVGLSFTVSKREGMICDPAAMKQLEMQRLEQAKIEDRWDIFNFGREETLKASVRAVECVIATAKGDAKLHRPQKARPPKTKRLLPLWEEREWVDA